MQQHDIVVKLNLQAHHNATSHQDEFVMESLVSHDQLKTLVADLLAAEVWKEHVWPRIQEFVANKVDSVTSYTLLYHEAAVANLLEICLFNTSALDALDEDYLIELVDWCHRKMLYLTGSKGQEDKEFRLLDAKAMMAQTPSQELEEKDRGLRHACAMCSLTILRYVTDHAKSLPLGLLTRMVSTLDVPMLLVALIDNPPWERRRDAVLERLVGNKWAEVQGADIAAVTQNAAQVWLALNNVVVDERFRHRYDWDDRRKETLQKAKRQMNEVLFDQLPPLKDLQRVIEEVALGLSQPKQDAGIAQAQRGGGAGGNSKVARGALILEVVPELRQALLRGRDWDEVARKMRSDVLAPDAPGRQAYAKSRMDEMVKSFEYMMEMEAKGAETAANAGAGMGASGAGQGDNVYVESRRRPVQKTGGIWTLQDHFSLVIDRDRAADVVELPPAKEGGEPMRGRRWRLKPLDRTPAPFPADGKIVIKHAGCEASATLSLPAPTSKEEARSVAPSLWVTCGGLREDGIALQLKVKRDEAGGVKDAKSGVYDCYIATAGAVTLRE